MLWSIPLHFTAKETITKTYMGARDRGIALIGLTMLLFERIWTLGVWIRKTIECFNCCLLDYPNRNMVDSGAKCDLINYGCLFQGVLQKNVRMCPRDQSCCTLVKNVTAFCPCLKHLPNAKVKSFWLIPLPVEISKQPTIDSVLWL